jgi:hypothetical protein
VRTEWLSDAEQAEADHASDACAKAVDALTSTFKLESQREVRTRDRIEAKILTKAAARVGCEVASVQPVRDSAGVMIGFTAPDAPKPPPLATT